MSEHQCQPSSGKLCPESSDCAMRLKLWGVAASLGLSSLMAAIGLLGRCEALVAAGLYSFYQAFLCGESVLSVDETGQPTSTAHCWFVSLVAGFILALGALDVLIFSVVRLVKASRGLLVPPSPWALLVTVIAIALNYQFSHYSACLARQPGGGHMEKLRRSFQTAMAISGLVFVGDMLGHWWPACDALAAIVVAGMLAGPVLELCVKRTTRTP